MSAQRLSACSPLREFCPVTQLNKAYHCKMEITKWKKVQKTGNTKNSITETQTRNTTTTKKQALKKDLGVSMKPATRG